MVVEFSMQGTILNHRQRCGISETIKQKKLNFLSHNYTMSCNFILQCGKNKGKQCSLKGKLLLSTKMYCTRHYKSQQGSEKPSLSVSVVGFDIIREIGKGAFGRVALIQDSDTQEYYAIKITSNKIKKEADLLYYEYLLLSQHFADNNAFPRLLPKVAKSYKRTEKETYLIMEHFEETLYQRFLKSNKQFSEGQIRSYGLQILNIIEYIHSKKHLYIDIKPENFMFKTEDDESIKIIDFGLCQRYVDYEGKHIKSNALSNPIGTDFYSSVRMMKCEQPGRIDDIECIGYLLLYLYAGELSWSKASSAEEILTIKQDSMFLDAPEYIKSFIMSIRGHSFDSKPDYDQFKEFLTT